MSNNYLSDEEFLEKLPQIGEGSEFRYETVVLPMGPNDLARMLSEVQRSYDETRSRISKLTGIGIGMSMIGRLRDIISLESDILDALRDRTADDIEEPYNYIVASMLWTVARINGDLSSLLDGICDGRVEDDPDSGAMDDCLLKLRILKSRMDGIPISS